MIRWKFWPRKPLVAEAPEPVVVEEEFDPLFLFGTPVVSAEYERMLAESDAFRSSRRRPRRVAFDAKGKMKEVKDEAR